jgi:DNA-binding MarR family transcriptional regulator
VAFADGLERLSLRVTEASAREERWLDRLRAGLVALLEFLDDEPQWSSLIVLRASVAGAAALSCSRRLHGVLANLLNEGRGREIAAEGLMPSSALMAELIAGGVFSLIRMRMLERRDRPLVELAPSLLAFMLAPYLGQAAARVELAESGRAAGEGSAPTGELPLPLPIPVTHRTTLVLRAIACTPLSSNREIARSAGLTDEGQTSHLLRRLERRGLIEHVTPHSGSRRKRAWLLTPCGRRVIELLSFGSAAAVDARLPSSRKVKAA